MQQVSPPKSEYQDGDSCYSVHSSSASPAASYSEPTLNTRPDPPARAHTAPSYHTDYSTSFISPPPSASQPHFQFAPSTIEPVVFEMRAGTPNGTGDIDGYYHTYTSLAHEESRRQCRIPLTSLPSWQSKFPHVSKLVQNNELNGACTMLRVNASVSTMDTVPPSKSLLWTQFEVSLPATASYDCSWGCSTRIYVPGKKVWDRSQPLSVSESLHGARKLTLPFASDFWSAFYTNLSEAQRTHDGNNSDETASRRKNREARAAIKSLTVVQEIFSTDAIGTRSRAAILLWEFSKAEGAQPGKAVWQEVVPPMSVSTPVSAIMPHSLQTPTAVPDGCGMGLYSQHTYPMSPYEDLSPTLAHAQPYYQFDGANRSAATTPGSGGVADFGTGMQGELGLGFFPQKYAYDESFGEGQGVELDVAGYMAQHSQHSNQSWPQHLSPMSEAQSLDL